MKLKSGAGALESVLTSVSSHEAYEIVEVGELRALGRGGTLRPRGGVLLRVRVRVKVRVKVRVRARVRVRATV